MTTYKVEDFKGPREYPLTQDDVQFMRDVNREHAIKMSRKLAEILEELLDERLTIQAEAWDAGYRRGYPDGMNEVYNPGCTGPIENPYRQKEEQA